VGRWLALLVATLSSAACGGSLASDAHSADGGGPDVSSVAIDSGASQDSGQADSTIYADASTDAPSDAASEATAGDAAADGPDDSAGDVAVDAPDDGAAESAAPCDVDAGCYVIPTGWSIVAFSTTQVACPTGFAATGPTDYLGAAQPSDACACGTCTVNSPPTCDWAGIGGFYDIHDAGVSTCASADSPSVFTNDPPGKCGTDLPTRDYSAFDLEFVAPGPAGGSVMASASVLTSPVTFPWEGESCSPDSAQAAGCVGSECTLTLPPPFRVCVLASPFVVCPPGSAFTQSYFERVGPSVWCSTCDCSVTATCGGTVELFSDSQCTANESDVPADSQCHPAPAGIGVVNSYRYVASAATNVGGAPLGLPITETLWTDTVTVCCPP
jgi:hypothetical protein